MEGAKITVLLPPHSWEPIFLLTINPRGLDAIWELVGRITVGSVLVGAGHGRRRLGRRECDRRFEAVTDGKTTWLHKVEIGGNKSSDVG